MSQFNEPYLPTLVQQHKPSFDNRRARTRSPGHRVFPDLFQAVWREGERVIDHLQGLTPEYTPVIPCRIDVGTLARQSHDHCVEVERPEATHGTFYIRLIETWETVYPWGDYYCEVDAA